MKVGSALYRIIYRYMRGRYVLSEKDLDHRTKKFIRDNVMIALCGMGVFILVAGAYGINRHREAGQINLSRRDYGQGEESRMLILEKGEESTRIEVRLKERQLSPKEIREDMDEMFAGLPETLKGENKSLSFVRKPLLFAERIDGYPFLLSYESEDYSFLRADGSLGDQAEGLGPGEKKYVDLTVKAVCGSIQKEKKYQIGIMAAEKEKETVFTAAENMIRKKEEESRHQRSMSLPSDYQGISIRQEEKEQSVYGLFLLLFTAVPALPLHRFLSLKEGSERIRRQTKKDFTTIVNLLALFMGTGASFPMAVRRINKDYRRKKKKQGERYAFEKMLVMEQQLDAGVSQRQACRDFGNQFEEAQYRKLASVLIQGFRKGARESRRLMSLAEEEAFRDRIDQVRKEGEEAATRLVFPMVVLLMTVLVLVMFPALIRFHTF